jgi:photosystem II stability/assembly factor-like uncharacterized protein
MKYFLAVVGLVAFGLLPGPVMPAVNGWSNAGPSGAGIRGIAYVNGNGVAVGVSHRRVYRTTNHGVSWAQVLAAPYGLVPLIAANPANGSQILAALDVLYRSTDGGLTWNAVAGLPPQMYVQNSRPSAMIWTRDGSAVWIGTWGGLVFRSVDGGATWALRNTGIGTQLISNDIVQIEVDAVSADTLYALTPSNLYRTTNGGANWALLANPNLYNHLAPSRVTAGLLLAMRTSDATQVRSNDFGNTWTPVGQTGSGPTQFAPSVADKAYLMSYDGSVQVTANQGTTWTDVAPLPVNSATAITIDPTDGNRLMVATLAGVSASADGGATWQVRSAGLNELYFFDTFARGGASSALFASSIDEQTIYQRNAITGEWAGIAATSAPVLGKGGETALAVAVAPSDGTLFIARPGNFGRSNDGGTTWQRRGTSDIVGKLAIDPGNPLVIYSTDVFIRTAKSIDGGATWANAGTGLPVAVAAFAIDPANANDVYALSTNNDSQSRSPLYRSIDAGLTWNPTAWTGSTLFRGSVLALEPGTPSTIYVGLDTGLFRTTDSGATWTPLTPYPLTTAPDIYSIAIDPQSPNIVYVSTTRTFGPMRSVDRGATWEALPAATGAGEVYIDKVAMVPGAHAALVGLGGYGGMFEMEVAPDLRVTATGSGTAASSPANVVLTVTNQGVFSATAVRLTSQLPEASAGYTATATGGTCTVNVRQLTCDFGTVRPVGTAGVTLGFTPNAPGTWQAAVAAYEPDSVSTNNTLDLLVGPVVLPSPPSKGGGGGGGGGRFDYLLLGLLGALTMRGVVRTR